MLLDGGRYQHCHQDQLLLRVIESNPLNEFYEATISIHLSIPFSSIEESLEVTELDTHSHNEMSDSNKAHGTGIWIAIIHREPNTSKRDIKPVGHEMQDHMLFTIIFVVVSFYLRGKDCGIFNHLLI